MKHIDFDLPIPDWDKISIDVYMNTFNEVKERFEDIIQESETITSRAVAIFTLMLGLSGFMTQKFSGTLIDFLIAAVVSIIFICAIYLMMPKGIYRRGTSPDTILIKSLTSEKKEIEQLRIYFCLQVQTYYKRCENMRALNSFRINILLFSGIFLIIAIALLFIKFMNVN